MRVLSDKLVTEGLLFRADARVKLMSAVVLLVMVLSYRGFVFPLTVAGICLMACIVMRVPLRVFVLRFSEPMFIAGMVVVLKFLFSGQDEMFSVNVLGAVVTGHRDGLLEGLLIACRVLAAVSIVATMGFATPFTELMGGLAWLRMPRGLVEILLLAYRYIFLIFEEALVIYNSQKNRLGYSSIRRGLRSFGTLTGSLVLRAFENSQQMGMAMMQRGYDGHIPACEHKPFKPSEVMAASVFLILMGVVWAL